jgi:hypothetical protein
MSLDEAIKEAIDYCVENGIMSDFLNRHGSEVRNMLYTEFNIDEAKKVWQEETKRA